MKLFITGLLYRNAKATGDTYHYEKKTSHIV